MKYQLEKESRVAFLFPDYEALVPGFAQHLYHHDRIVQEYVEEAAHISGLPVARFFYNSSISELHALPDCYQLLFVQQVSICAYLRSQGIAVIQVGGLGTGVYSALCAAGSFTFAEGLYMLSKWGVSYEQLLHEKNFKKILIVGIPEKNLTKILAGYDHAQIVLSEKFDTLHFAVSGLRLIVEEFQAAVIKQYASSNITEMPLESGLYANFMQETTAYYRQYLEKIEFKNPELPVYLPYPSKELSSAQVKEIVACQETVYQDHMYLIDQFIGVDTIIMPGAGKNLSALVQTRYPEKKIITVIDERLPKEVLYDR